jgi:hypothetical protein
MHRRREEISTRRRGLRMMEEAVSIVLERYGLYKGG